MEAASNDFCESLGHLRFMLVMNRPGPLGRVRQCVVRIGPEDFDQPCPVTGVVERGKGLAAVLRMVVCFRRKGLGEVPTGHGSIRGAHRTRSRGFAPCGRRTSRGAALLVELLLGCGRQRIMAGWSPDTVTALRRRGLIYH